MELVDSSIPSLFTLFSASNATDFSLGKAIAEPSLIERYQDLRQHRTYISFGSHSESLSLAGGQAMLDYFLGRLDSKSLLFEGADEDEERHIRFQKTTSVHPGLIPGRFGQQGLLRNSVLINRRNELLDEDYRTRDRVVSFDTNALALHPQRSDAVHFMSGVYSDWARILIAEMQL
jgi:hypothetical protein